MSRTYNRNLKKKFELDCLTANFLQREPKKMTIGERKVISPVHCCGKELKKKNSFENGKRIEDLFILDGYGESADGYFEDDLFFDDGSSLEKSCSSSSLSWGCDYEEGNTKTVEKEFERMEKILKGEEMIPNNYPEDEFKLWMRTFSLTRLLGQQKKYSAKQKTVVVDSTKEIETTNDSCMKISSAVINDIFENVSSHFADQRNNTIKKREKKSTSDEEDNCKRGNWSKTERLYRKRNQDIEYEPSRGHKPDDECKQDRYLKHQKDHEYTNNKTNDFPLEIEFSNLLRISPAPANEMRNRSSKKKRNTPKQKQISISKWLRSESPEFASLPHLGINQLFGSKQSDFYSLSDIKRKSASPSRKEIKSKNSPNKKQVTLPPINKNLEETNQFRSISATPRQMVFSNSAASVKSMMDRRPLCGNDNSIFASERYKGSFVKSSNRWLKN